MELVFQRLQGLKAVAPGTLEFALACQLLENSLADPFFLEAKTEAGLVFELASDLSETVAGLPKTRPMRRVLSLLDEAIRRDIHFHRAIPNHAFSMLMEQLLVVRLPG